MATHLNHPLTFSQLISTREPVRPMPIRTEPHWPPQDTLLFLAASCGLFWSFVALVLHRLAS